MIQNHALLDRQCLVSGSLDNIPITILTDTGSSISLLDEHLYYSLSSIPPLQPIQFSVSGTDDRPLIALGTATLSIAINNNIFRVQLVVTRNILSPVVLGINFLQTHDGIISFPTNQLYLTNSSLKPASPPINAHLIRNTYAPLMNTFTPYHPHSRITVRLDQPYHVINTAPVTIPPRTNTIMTIPCTLPHTGNYLFEPSQQHFVDHPVQYTPVIIDAANDNLPVHFINHSDHEIVIPKHSYVGAMEKVHEPDQHIVHTHTPLEPVSQHALSECLAHSDLLPNQRQSLCIVLQENSNVFGSSIVNLTSTPLVKHYIDTGNAKPIKQTAYCASHHYRQEIEKQVEEMLQNGIIQPSVSPWASPVVLVTKADKTLRLRIDYRSLNKATIKDSYPLPHIQDALDTLYGNTLFTTLDLLKGYHQIEVEESSREKPAFTTHVGLFQYIRLPLGLTNAPASFQRLL